MCVFVCMSWQNPPQRTRYTERAWTARRPGSPLTPGAVWSASSWRRTAAPWCPLVSTPTNRASSTWTTQKCLPRRQTLTRSSGRRMKFVGLRLWGTGGLQCGLSMSSRRRSSSLGSGDDDREELTSAQLTKRIHILKKKIQRFEERFEEDRKYRVGHH